MSRSGLVILAGTLALAIAPGVAGATDAPDLAARYGAPQDVRWLALSPDGQKIAVVTPRADRTRVLIIDLLAGSSVKQAMWLPSRDGQINSCVWATVSRVICQVRFVAKQGPILASYSRMFAVNADGSNLVKLTLETNLKSHEANQTGGDVIDYVAGGQVGSVLITRNFVPDTALDTRIGSDKSGLGVERVDTSTLARRTIEPPVLDATMYLADGQGNVRVMGRQPATSEGYLKGSVLYSYRQAGDREWRRLSTTEDKAGFRPVAIDASTNSVLGFETENGFVRLSSISLDGTLSKRTVLSRPDVDVDHLLTIGRMERVIGGSYAYERRTVEYFDHELDALSKSLSKALPGQPAVHIVGASDDESRLLIIASSDVDPGVLYYYNKASRHLDEILPLRRALEGLTFAPMRAVQYKAADGTLIPAYLTLPAASSGKGLPALVMPHGGPSARDEWGFDWLAQFFATRGYAVIQPNYRGSSGYGTAWFQKNGFQSWRTAVGDINDAGRWLLSEGIAAPGKLAAFGWSYGGYASLQGAAIAPDLYKAVVAVAPVTDLAWMKREALYFTNGRLVGEFIGDGPQMEEGSPVRNASRITAPVLLFHGDLDENVDVEQSRLMTKKLKENGRAVTYVEFPGLDHQLESGEARTRLLSESDAFLRKAMGLIP